AEWKVSHRRSDTDVDADISGRSFVAEASCGRTAGREQRGLIAVGAALQKCERFVETLSVNQAKHRTKNLGVREFAFQRNVVENGGLHEMSLFGARDFG